MARSVSFGRTPYCFLVALWSTLCMGCSDLTAAGRPIQASHAPPSAVSEAATVEIIALAAAADGSFVRTYSISAKGSRLLSSDKPGLKWVDIVRFAPNGRYAYVLGDRQDGRSVLVSYGVEASGVLRLQSETVVGGSPRQIVFSPWGHMALVGGFFGSTVFDIASDGRPVPKLKPPGVGAAHAKTHSTVSVEPGTGRFCVLFNAAGGDVTASWVRSFEWTREGRIVADRHDVAHLDFGDGFIRTVVAAPGRRVILRLPDGVDVRSTTPEPRLRRIANGALSGELMGCDAAGQVVVLAMGQIGTFHVDDPTMSPKYHTIADSPVAGLWLSQDGRLGIAWLDDAQRSAVFVKNPTTTPKADGSKFAFPRVQGAIVWDFVETKRERAKP